MPLWCVLVQLEVFGEGAVPLRITNTVSNFMLSGNIILSQTILSWIYFPYPSITFVNYYLYFRNIFRVNWWFAVTPHWNGFFLLKKIANIVKCHSKLYHGVFFSYIQWSICNQVTQNICVILFNYCTIRALEPPKVVKEHTTEFHQNPTYIITLELNWLFSCVYGFK